MAASSPSLRKDGEEKGNGSQKGAGSRSASGNRVKSRPAKDAVIKGILSQLGNLDATQTSTAARHTSFSRPDFSDFDQDTRPDSAAGSFASAPSIPFSPSNVVRPPRPITRASDDEDEAFDDVATPPIVPITRSPMRLSQQQPVLHNALSYDDSEPVIASSSKRTSLQPPRSDMETVSRKTSKESWATADQHSPEQKRRQIRRVESHETLRQAQPDRDFQPDQDFILNGLGSLATSPRPVHIDVDDAAPSPSLRHSPKMLGKARLYYQDSAEDFQRTTSADLAVKDADTLSNHSRGSSAGPSTPRVNKLRSSASKASPITDSIPLRTSSLRQSSSPASTGRRSKMKSSTPHSVSLVRTISEEDAEDEHWAELGEEDETVRRIRELRKKRKSRMHEDHAATPIRASSALAHRTADVLTPARPHSSASEQVNSSSTTTTNNNNNNKASKILGLASMSTSGAEQQQQQQQNTSKREAHAATSSTTTQHPAGNGASTNEGTGRLQLKRPQTPEVRHASPVRPLSLDYSYAHAVDALQQQQSASNNSSPQRRSRKAHQGMNLGQPIAFYHRRTTSNNSNTSNSLLRPKKQRGRLVGGNSDDGDEKSRSRRKSMSDARKSDDYGAEPQRRDSVEHAVLAYLNDSRLSQHVLDPQTQRRISFSEVGDPRGAAVMVCVGMGLTRFVTAFFDELATTLRLRLITIERPGVGLSEPYPPNDRSGPLMWAADVTTVTDHLGISKFSMLAHSAGAVYALATALTLPHYVRGSIHLLGPWIPPSQLEAVSYATDNAIPAGALPRSQRILRVLPAPLIRMANNSFVFSSLKPERQSSGNQNGITHSTVESKPLPKRPTTSSGPRPENPRRESLMLMDQFMPDTNPMENFPLSSTRDEKTGELQRRRSSVFLGATIDPNDPSFTFAGEALYAAEHSAREREVEFSSRLTQRTWEYAIKDSNPATDLLVCLERNREIGFRYTDITRRVIITHGSEDKRVPVGNVKWLADQMNRAGMQRQAISRDTLSLDTAAEPGCELRILENEGHGLMASPIIMADILTEIAGYWTAEERGRRPSHNL